MFVVLLRRPCSGAEMGRYGGWEDCVAGLRAEKREGKRTVKPVKMTSPPS